MNSSLVSHSGYRFETVRERLKFAATELEIECLKDIDKTIDDLFIVYQEQGRTELFEEMCPYFGILWPSGKVLASELDRVLSRAEHERPIWARQSATALELGCGLAVVSMVLAKHGWTVDVVDQHPDARTFLEHNLQSNQIQSVQYLGREWADVAATGRTWPLVVASDVLYDKSQPARLCEVLGRTVSPGGLAIIADPGRTYLEAFIDLMESRNWRSEIWGESGITICEFHHPS